MKRTAQVVGILIALLLVIVVAVPFLIDANQFRPALQSRLTAALGREVKLGDLKVSLFSGAVSASDLSVADDPAFSRQPFLSAQSVDIHVRMAPLLFSRKLEITGITIDQPHIALIETPQGVFNFSNIGAKAAASSPAPNAGSQQISGFSVAQFNISNGQISVEKAGARTKPLVLSKLNFEVKNFQPDAQFPFSFDGALSGGGAIKLDGTAGPLRSGEVAKTPFNATLRLTNLDLVQSGLVNPAAGIRGLVSFDGAAQSANGGSINMTGKINAQQLVLSKGGTAAKRPVQMDVAIMHDLATQSGEVSRMMIHVGNAAANISGRYNLATEPATVSLRLSGSKMPLVDLATLLPPLNVSLPAGASLDQGTADVSLTSQGALDNLVTRGTLEGQNVRLANYDFASKLQVLHQFTGIKAQPHTTIQTFRTNVNNTTQGTTLDGLQLSVVSVGAIAGAGTISASHALNFKMRAAVGGAALASLAGSAGIPFVIQGTAENPSIRPDVKNLVTDQLKNLQNGKSPADAASGLLKGLFGGKKK